MGNKLFKYNKRIKFLSELPKTVSGIDIIHVGSALQYVENWRKMLKEFVRLKPSYILFTDLQAGDIPTYVTAQNYYDSKIPVWFFNILDIIKEFDGFNYKLVFKSTFRGSFFEKNGPSPIKSPQKFRLKILAIYYL